MELIPEDIRTNAKLNSLQPMLAGVGAIIANIGKIANNPNPGILIAKAAVTHAISNTGIFAFSPKYIVVIAASVPSNSGDI